MSYLLRSMGVDTEVDDSEAGLNELDSGLNIGSLVDSGIELTPEELDNEQKLAMARVEQNIALARAHFNLDISSTVPENARPSIIPPVPDQFREFIMAGLPPAAAIIAMNMFIYAMAMAINGGDVAIDNPELTISMVTLISLMAGIMAFTVRHLLVESLEMNRI